MPLQSEIINLVAGFPYISIVDATGYFYQFLVQRRDRHKLTVVSHRGQEQFNVAIMGYKGSPLYVQRQTDHIFREIRERSRAYVDDIITFSEDLSRHLNDLRKLFTICQNRRVTLSPDKSFLGYPNVMLLGQRVDSLGLSTAEEKIKAIKALKFPATLQDLQIYLGLTGWLRSSIPRYAQLAQPLQDRKTALTRALPNIRFGNKAKGGARKQQSITSRVNNPTKEEIESYN